ncbi:MAG: S-layer family protein, partial [Cyanobacteria bacterium P01_E01_bin.43]
INAESTNAASGDGGNIFIDTGFLVSVPGDNNDIIANAVGGDGGRVEVNAVNIFGFSESQGLTTNELRANTTNDLSASSAQGVEGEITLNTLNLDPSRGLGTLPAGPIDASQLIDQTLCEAGQGSNFVVTGRGGLPSAPADALGAVTPWEDWSFAEDTAFDLPSTALEIETTDLAPPPLVEAQGATRAEDGRIVLSAEAASVTPAASAPLSQSCRTVPPVAPSSDRSSTPSSPDKDTP